MKRAFTLIELIVVVVILFVLGAILVGGCRWACSSTPAPAGTGGGGGTTIWSESTARIKVLDTYAAGGEMGTVYRVIAQTADGTNETFQVADSALLDGQFNSADIFAALRLGKGKGKVFDVRCRGYRSGQWSQFRNIVEILSETKAEQW